MVGPKSMTQSDGREGREVGARKGAEREEFIEEDDFLAQVSAACPSHPEGMRPTG